MTLAEAEKIIENLSRRVEDLENQNHVIISMLERLMDETGLSEIDSEDYFGDEDCYDEMEYYESHSTSRSDVDDWSYEDCGFSSEEEYEEWLGDEMDKRD